jgi:hypothetical protein
VISFVSGATTYFNDPDTPKQHLGRFTSPRAGNDLQLLVDSGMPWAADNDCFSGFNRNRFIKMLQRMSKLDLSNCKFVSAPDVVADAVATLARFKLWLPVMRYYGVPIALVLQNGMENMELPWDDIDAVFIGGSIAWKLSLEAAGIVAEAKRRGKWVHMGRVNSAKRRLYAESIGCDSTDGTGDSRFAFRDLPKAVEVMSRRAKQVAFFGDLA